MNVSSVKNLNGEVFSAVQDASLTNVVQTNSGNWQDITAYQNNSASYQLSGNYIPYTAYDDSNTAFETNSGLSINRFGEGGLYNTLLSPNTIQMSFVASPTLYYWAILSDTSLKFETSSDSAYVDKEKIHTWDSASYYIQNISANWDDVSTTVQTNSASWAEEVISSYTTATIEGINAINSLNGKPLISFRTQSAQEAGTANKARYDYDGNNLADDHNSLTALNNVVQTNSAQWAEQPTYEYDISNKISAINGSAIAAGDEFPVSADEAIQCVQSNSSNWQSVSNKLDSDVFTAWSANQADNNYQLSAGDGINIIDDDINKITRIDVTAQYGDMFTSYLEYNDQNQISGYAGSAFAGQGGGDVPTGTMNVSGLEYNAVNEISAYNGSAISQYGAEKQWLVHDDTLVHAANSAQYALGVNLSALQRLMGIDETVLWEGVMSATGTTADFLDNIKDFERIKVYSRRAVNGVGRPFIINEFQPTYSPETRNAFVYNQVVNIESNTHQEDCMYMVLYGDTNKWTLTGGWRLNGVTQTTGVTSYLFKIEKIVGVHRISG